MEVKIQQWGNSAAIRLPATVLKQMSLANGDVLRLDVCAEALTLTSVKAKPHYRLADLIAQCDPNAPEPDDLKAWDNLSSVGREA